MGEIYTCRGPVGGSDTRSLYLKWGREQLVQSFAERGGQELTGTYAQTEIEEIAPWRAAAVHIGEVGESETRRWEEQNYEAREWKRDLLRGEVGDQAKRNALAADRHNTESHTFGRGELLIQLRGRAGGEGYCMQVGGIADLMPTTSRTLGRPARGWVQLALGAVPTSNSMRLKTTNTSRGIRRDRRAMHAAMQCTCGNGAWQSSTTPCKYS